MASAYQGKKPYIFLSYSHKDEELALSVIEYLQEKYFNVWFDEGIHTETYPRPDVIIDKIANCSVMVFLATQNSLASEWCGNELSFAKKEGKKFINVVIGKPTIPDWFKLSCADYQFLYEKNFTNREAMLVKLVEELIHHQMNPNKSKDTPKDTPKETPKAKAPEVTKVPAPTQKSSDPSVAPKASPAPSRTKGLRFTFKGNTAKVSRYVGTGTKVIIPATITPTVKTYKVTSIENSAFKDCTSLTSITIPDSVTSIGAEAFRWCDNLTSIDVDENNQNYKSIDGNLYSKDGSTLIQYAIGKTETSFTIPDHVTSIGEDAFAYCKNLTSITIPNSVTSIGRDAFAYCKNLTSITIPDGVTSIGDFAFTWCKNLTSITIPDSITSIGKSAFWGCSSLTSISIPDGVTTIGRGAFWGCSSLTSITIPNCVTTIEEDSFRDCTNLTSITIPNNVTTIGHWAFGDCKNLTSITIPDSVTSIGTEAFRWCDNLTSIDVDENNQNYKSIDGNLYSKDGSTLIQYAIGKTATSFTIPNSVTSIGYGAFAWCENLTSITIPKSVTSIGEDAFSWCSSLTSITIPKGVKSIGYWAFSGCTNLTIYCEAKSKPEGWHTDWHPDNRPVVWGCELK